MRFLQRALAALSLGLVAFSVAAAPAQPRNGVDYRTLEKPQQTESGKKVEVTEFFWYSCPHCNALEPALVDWVKKQGDRIAFKRVPVAFRDSFVPQQKLFYTLEAMGKLDPLHHKVFQAIHKERNPLATDAAIFDWAAKQGLDKEKFREVYNSFGVQAKANRAKQLQSAYQVDGVPMLAVDGKYITSPAIVSAQLGRQPEAVLHSATLQVLDHLVAKAAQEDGSASSGDGQAGKKAKQ